MIFFCTVDCASLDDPTISYSTGALSNGNYPTGTIADYSCTLGELFNGDATRHCLSGGAWSGSEPNCSSKFVTVKPVIISMEPSILTIFNCAKLC